MKKIKNWFITSLMDTKSKEKYVIENIEDDLEKELKTLAFKHKYEDISKDEYDKAVATANKEPYVRVLSIDLDEKSPGSGFFELDFNEHFVEHLANSGYEGVKEDEIVDNWFSDLCRNIVLNDLEDDKGDPKSFDSASKEGLIIKRLKTGEDEAEYS
jgi:hypothetical protein